MRRWRDRLNPNKKFLNSEADEVAFGSRKYYRGRRVRKHTGVQWGLTIVSVCPVTNSPLQIDLQMLKYNTRSAEVITPLIVQRCSPGGTLTTDCWKAYPAAAKAAGVVHKTVNHSVEFVNRETGECTNRVEGLHRVLKKDSRSQFDRLPYLTQYGETYYLDLLVFRCNCRLQKQHIFIQFADALWKWTPFPLSDYDGYTPVRREEDEEEVVKEVEEVEDENVDIMVEEVLEDEGSMEEYNPGIEVSRTEFYMMTRSRSRRI